jgi:hypothetical protein
MHVHKLNAHIQSKAFHDGHVKTFTQLHNQVNFGSMAQCNHDIIDVVTLTLGS